MYFNLFITMYGHGRTGRLVQNEACVVKPLVNGVFMEHSFKKNAGSNTSRFHQCGPRMFDFLSATVSDHLHQSFQHIFWR